MKKIRKAVIPAAGYGTGFLPATKATPKEMLPIVDKPVIQYIVEEALQSGIEEILIVSGHGKRAIEDHFDTNLELEMQLRHQGKNALLHMVQKISEINIHYVHQKHMRGLGDAILCAKDFIDDEPFAVLLGDTLIYTETEPVLQQLMNVYYQTGTTLLGYQQVPLSDVSSYGIIEGMPKEGRDLLQVTHIVEKPDRNQSPSCYAAMGRYIIHPDIFEALQRVAPHSNKEIQLTDALNILVERETVCAYPLVGTCYDVGCSLEYLKATVDYALRRDDLGAAFLQYVKGLI
ncbi:MAG: UTP--glucose-1-phosphate uridylyltransferase GalU [Megasphaera cerevisiae]|jgi:UTP--glucose-1-phosphate uridylyltransferase|nr:UTP--glucose-1-phosphate uridylyltransferase GalU [Megasphaera cerevisiae]